MIKMIAEFLNGQRILKDIPQGKTYEWPKRT